MEMVWRPGVASSEQGALQAFCGSPSNVAVAPPGLLMMATGWVAAMAGAGLAGGFSAGGSRVGGLRRGSGGEAAWGSASVPPEPEPEPS